MTYITASWKTTWELAWATLLQNGCCRDSQKGCVVLPPWRQNTLTSHKVRPHILLLNLNPTKKHRKFNSTQFFVISLGHSDSKSNHSSTTEMLRWRFTKSKKVLQTTSGAHSNHPNPPKTPPNSHIPILRPQWLQIWRFLCCKMAQVEIPTQKL